MLWTEREQMPCQVCQFGSKEANKHLHLLMQAECGGGGEGGGKELLCILEI